VEEIILIFKRITT